MIDVSLYRTTKFLTFAIPSLLFVGCDEFHRELFRLEASKLAADLSVFSDQIPREYVEEICNSSTVDCTGGAIGFDILAHDELIVLLHQNAESNFVTLFYNSESVEFLRGDNLPIGVERTYQRLDGSGPCEPSTIDEIVRFFTDRNQLTVRQNIWIPDCDGGHSIDPETGLRNGYEKILSESEITIFSE